MKKVLLLILLVAVSYFSVNAQKKMYVYPPETNEYNATGLLDGKEIYLKFKDTRIIPPKSKVECTFDQLSECIGKALMQTYPKAKFTNNPESGISITINIKSYDVAFYTGAWSAETRYVVLIKNGDKEEEKDIEEISRFFNVLGNKTAKSTLNKCFNNANVRLFEFINDVLE